MKRVGAVLGLAWGRLGPSWIFLEASWSHLGTMMGPSWAPLGRLGASWGHLWLSWSRLAAVLGCLGPSWASSWVVLGRPGAFGASLRDVWGPSCSHLGASSSHLGTILGPSRVPLGRLWASWRHVGPSWSCLGAVLGRPGSIKFKTCRGAHSKNK